MQDQDLAIREELLSLHALNPFISASSSPRCLMMSGHLSQIVVIENGEPQIIQTGLDPQLAENTFSKQLDSDARILAILKRYNGISANSVSELAEYVVIVQNIENGELDAISIPRFHKLHQNFGFMYNVNKKTLNPGVLNTVLPEGTIFADSPTVKDNKEYCFGRPVNIAYLSIPEVTGDGVVISEDLANKYAFRTHETIVVEFGEGAFPLNLYGDENNYKPFPDIGELINKDRVVIATREYDQELAPGLVSAIDVREFSPYFDKPFYSKTDGGRVVDIKVYHNPRAGKSTYTKTTDQVNRYSEALKQYYRDILNVYEAQNDTHYRKHKADIPVSPRFHRLLMDACAITEDKRNIRFTYKNDLVDIYRVEFTIEHVTIPDCNGFKFTTLHG